MVALSLPVLSDGGLARYMDDINKFPMLSEEEELSLAKDLAEKGDIDAAHKLVTSHLRLVVKLAMGYRGYGLPVIDIISEGNIGLMQAVKKFDYTKGFRLSTYAMWWIKASINEYILRSWSLVKMGTSAAQKKLFFNLKRLKGKIFNDQSIEDRVLYPEEVKSIATELDVSESDVLEMDQRITASDYSLNKPMANEEDGGQWIDYLEDNSESHEVIIAESEDLMRKKAIMEDAMKSLNEREQAILFARRMKEPADTLEDLSQEYGISRERVRQIEVRALEKLQDFIQKQ